MEVDKKLMLHGSRGRAAKLRKAVFNRGEVPAGTRSTAELYIEADEVWVRVRREDGKRGVGLKVNAEAYPMVVKDIANGNWSFDIGRLLGRVLPSC